MRLILALLVLVSSLTGCACGPNAEPRLIVKSPLWFDTQPVLAPQGYAIRQEAPAVYAPVQQLQQVPAYCAPPAIQAQPYIYAPAVQPRAYDPCNGAPTGPVPTDPNAPPESIPAVRR